MKNKNVVGAIIIAIALLALIAIILHRHEQNKNQISNRSKTFINSPKVQIMLFDRKIEKEKETDFVLFGSTGFNSNDQIDPEKLREIRTIIADGNIEKALNVLNEIPLKEFDNLLIAISSDLKRLERKRIAGIISEANHSEQESKITFRLLSLLTRLNKT